MRITLVLVAVCLLLAVGALGLFLMTGVREAPPEHPAVSSLPAAPTSPQSGAAERQTGELLARMDALARQIDDLESQIAELKAGAAREPVPAAAPELASEKPLDNTSAAFAAVHHDAILKVIEDDRLAQQKKREEEQRARDMQTLLARAERTAQRFGLSADQQKSLADVYLLERQKMEDMRTQMRDQGGFGGDPAAFRESIKEMRDWRLNELTTRLGSDLAEKINEADFERFRGMGGFGRGNRGPGGGNAGQDGGGQPGGGF
jgi:cell division protein FtsB